MKDGLQKKKSPLTTFFNRHYPPAEGRAGRSHQTRRKTVSVSERVTRSETREAAFLFYPLFSPNFFSPPIISFLRLNGPPERRRFPESLRPLPHLSKPHSEPSRQPTQACLPSNSGALWLASRLTVSYEPFVSSRRKTEIGIWQEHNNTEFSFSGNLKISWKQLGIVKGQKSGGDR